MDMIKNAIDNLSAVMSTQPQSEIAVSHVFSGGMCARTMMAKKGTWIIGARHFSDHVNIISEGKLLVITDDDADVIGPCVLPSCAGVRRVGFVIEDVVWTTMLKTDLTDIEEIERTMMNKNPTTEQLKIEV